MEFYPNANTCNDTVTWLHKCPCCGEEDTVLPCRDCVAYCPGNELCKARGVTKLRLRLADLLQAARNWVDPRG